MKGRPLPELPILLVDDEEAILSSNSKVLIAAGIDRVLTCSDAREVLSTVERQDVEAILLDLSMPYLRGEELLKELRDKHPEIPVIIVTASDDLETAVRCMKQGAFDYMVKAVEPSRLISGVMRAIDLRKLSRQYSSLKEHLFAEDIRNHEAFARFITACPRVEAVFRFVEAIAPTAETVLVTGETGTGKELIAESIHAASGRQGSMVKINSAGLDDAVFADTLFGHSRGAFTGAEAMRKGLVQQAEQGTLFLDEIGDLTATSQIKLLRLVEAREYYPLGSDLPRITSARFVIATNRDLPLLVSQGLFRRDLYYRLQTHEIHLPPLRDRKEDLPYLLDHFLDEATRELGKKKLAVPRELPTLLAAYDFPGNVRELRSMIFSAVSLQKEKTLSLGTFRKAMGKGLLDPRSARGGAELAFPDRLPTLREQTEALVAESLKRAKGNQAIAALLLGITPQALSKRLSRRRRTDVTS